MAKKYSAAHVFGALVAHCSSRRSLSEHLTYSVDTSFGVEFHVNVLAAEFADFAARFSANCCYSVDDVVEMTEWSFSSEEVEQFLEAVEQPNV